MRIVQTVCLFAVIAATRGWAQLPMDVQTGSMEPAIPTGSKVFVNPFSYTASEPVRYDIIAFHPPLSPFLNHNPKVVFFSRVIGLPGETISMTTNSVTINGQPLGATNGVHYGLVSINPHNILRNGDAFRLSTNEFFVLSDNVRNAVDSRYLGAVPRSNIVGRVVRIVKKDEK